MPPQGAAYDADWILSNTSNVHVATDRAWFTTYMPYRTKVSPMPGAQPSIEIHGIGTVVLPTRTHRNGKARKPSREITLHHVLYAPHSATNIFATACGMEPELDIPPTGRGDVTSVTERGTNKVVGLIVHLKLPKLWLKGQPQNQSSLNPQAIHYIHASWPDGEISKYKTFVTEFNASQSRSLTPEEKKVLKQNYGGEFKFLVSYGLSIHKQADRQEGRRILRHLMSGLEDKDNTMEDANDDGDNDKQSVDIDDFQAEIERDPASHVADYKFTANQLDYLKNHYGHSGDFIRSHGLSPWDDDDCILAVQVLEELMNDDNDDDDDYEKQSVDSDDFQAEIERDPFSHFADHKFTANQLDYLKKYYDHSGDFMRSYHLKPWDDDDCNEAVRRLKKFIDADVERGYW